MKNRRSATHYAIAITYILKKQECISSIFHSLHKEAERAVTLYCKEILRVSLPTLII